MTIALRTRLGSFGLCMAFFVALLNVSVMYLAVPQVQSAFGTDLSDGQWFVGIYGLMQGGFMLAAGTAGDILGRRRALLAGVVIFALASIASALAPNIDVLVVARGFEGLGSAAMLVLPPAILVAMLPTGDDEGPAMRTLGNWGAIASGMAPAIGGAVVTYFTWRGVFWLSAVLAVLAIVPVLVLPREQKSNKRSHVDIVGQALSITGLLAISYGLIEGDAQGWLSQHIITAFATGVGALAAFAINELWTKHPMIHIRYFTNRRFLVSLVTLAIVNFAWYGIFLLAAIFLEAVRHESALTAGLFMLPCNVTYFAANIVSVGFVRRFGFSAAIIVSFATTIGGIIWLAHLTAASSSYEVAAALAVAGIGWGLIITPAAALGMEAIPDEDDGFASATEALVRALSGVVGIALLGSLPGNSIDSATFMAGWPLAMIVCGVAVAVTGAGLASAVRRRDADLPTVEGGSA